MRAYAMALGILLTVAQLATAQTTKYYYYADHNPQKSMGSEAIGGVPAPADPGDPLDVDVTPLADDGAFFTGVSDRFASAPVSFNPTMIGDMAGSAAGYAFSSGGGLVPIAGGNRRYKIAENDSIFPQCRAYFNYNHFHQALRGPDGRVVDLNRYTLGLERAFNCSTWSLGVRVPIIDGLDSTQVPGSTLTGGEFGNVTLTLKRLLWNNCNGAAVAAGLGVTLPTGDDGVLAGRLIIENESVHLAPYIGAYVPIGCRSFVQSYLQFDFDAGDNTVHDLVTPATGRIDDQDLLYADVQFGRWLYQNPCGRINGIAGIVELHYTTTLQDTDTVLGVTNPFNNQDYLNITGGLKFALGRSELTVATAAPLRDREDRLFDSEILVNFNRYY